ncbi:MAG: hypothetical protein DWH79_01295 [Planctomycetota bacterium]|nr:MAG: hypothetical protein DWH79_01295 [Planctomycetota bacterium]
MVLALILQELSLEFDPVGSWWLVLLVTCLLAVVLLAVGPDKTRVSPGRRLSLVLLRLGAFLALIACLLRPTLVASRKARQQGTLLVLADASESMTVVDGAGGRTRWEEMSAALAAARPAAEKLIAEGDVDIALWTFDRDARPVAGDAVNPFPLKQWERGVASDQTAIGGALDDAVKGVGGRPLAGVIVLSDGAQHAYPPRDQPPQGVARKLGDAAVPLWTITFGQQRGGGQGRDAAVTNLSVGETVYLKNALEVAGRIRLDGLADRDVVVKLMAEDAAGGMEEAARTVVRGNAQGTEEAVRLTWTPKVLGERKLSLVVEPQEGEVVVTNNELSTFVEVIDGGLRVLYLEGALRVEQRFLRRVLAASPDMQVDFQWIDVAGRKNWPVDLGRTLAIDYNVILIGDLDASALSQQDLGRIVAKVNGGAGIGFLGGFHAFEAGGWGSTILGQLLPFEADRLARQPFDQPIRPGLHIPGPVKLVPDQRFGGISILRQGKSEQESRAVWQAMPPLEGANDLGRLVPTAKPLAVTGDGRPLLVAREFGEGRVLAFAADTTWRWAMQGALDQHRRFWRQLILWLAKQDDAEKDSLWVRLAQRRVSPGATIPFDAGLTKPDGTAVADAVIEAVVVSPGGTSRPVRMARKGELFSGVLAEFEEPGDWKVTVQATKPGAAAAAVRSARFTVVRQDLELANPRANPLLMRQLAEVTEGGGVRSPEELGEVFDDIRTRPSAFDLQQQWSATLWDKWPMFLLMAGLLCVEWYLRKRWGLV